MITLLVNYKLSEYLKVLRDFFPIMMRRDSELKCKRFKGVRWYHNTLILIMAPPMFAFKKIVVGTCSFTIDEEGISRKSKTGKKVIPWTSVLEVHELTEAYLIELKEGALPLPFRCFNSRDIELFRSYKRLVKPNNSNKRDTVTGLPS